MIHWPALLEQTFTGSSRQIRDIGSVPARLSFCAGFAAASEKASRMEPGIHRYTINHVVRLMIARCREIEPAADQSRRGNQTQLHCRR
jgi:hypothetical protein